MQIIKQCKSLSSSLCSFLLSSVSSSLLGLNNPLSTLFLYTLTLRSSLNANDQVSHPYKTTGQILVLYTLTVIFLDSQREDKGFCTERQQALPDFTQLLIYEYRTQKYLRKTVAGI